MRKTNKIVSLLLTLGMMLTLAIPAVVSAADLSFSDVPSDYPYYSAITNLTAEGIIEGFGDGTFKPEEPVTRAQFTKLICMAQNVGNIQYSEADRASFPDVISTGPEAHWAINFITTAKNSGIINGYDDGTFKPEESVLYEQAVKMAVCALGYTEDRAERAGGLMGAYPNGYINLASQAKLLDKITGAKLGEPLTRGRVAQLIDNMMDAETFDPVTGTTGGSSMREETSNRSSAEGRIVAVYGSSLYYDEESECNRKQIELELNNGDREFYGIENLDINDLNDYLGRSVIVYYDIETGADYYEAYNIAFQNRKNYEVTVNFDDIEIFENSKLEYYTEDREDTETISIDSDIAIIHNGMAVNEDFGDIIDEFTNQSGYLTLICSQNNDIADVAFVRTYETIVVNSKDSQDYKIYDYDDSSRSFVLDETDNSKTITFTKDGKASNFAGITVGSVVSVSTSEDGKLIDVQISTDKPKGTITDILSDDRIKLDTGSSYYRFTDSCDRSAEINAGMYIQLYLDAFGRIARYTISSESEYDYGYLAAVESGTIMDPKVEVMVYKLSSSSSRVEAKTYSLRSTVKIDGKTYTISSDMDQILDLLQDTASREGVNPVIDGAEPENATYSQPIRFTTSSSSVIDSILTLNSTGENNVSLNMEYYVDTPALCRATGSTLDKYTISGSIPVILVPSDRLDGTYMTRSSSYFQKDESYYVQVANASTTNRPGAIYVYGTESSGSDVDAEVMTEANLPMIVTQVSVVNYDDANRTRLTLLDPDGVESEVYDDGREGTEAIQTVEVGDVIRVAADGEGMVDVIQVLAVAEDVVSGNQEGCVVVDGTTEGTDDLDAPLRVVLGLVHNSEDNTVVMAPTFEYPTDEITENFTYTEDVKVYLVDTGNRNNPVRECSFSEIVGVEQQGDEGASKLMVYTEDGDVRSMIIFR